MLRVRVSCHIKEQRPCNNVPVFGRNRPHAVPDLAKLNLDKAPMPVVREVCRVRSILVLRTLSNYHYSYLPNRMQDQDMRWVTWCGQPSLNVRMKLRRCSDMTRSTLHKSRTSAFGFHNRARLFHGRVFVSGVFDPKPNADSRYECCSAVSSCLSAVTFYLPVSICVNLYP